jgi:tetratricopeptide (TPR) repeat protein
VIGWLGDFFRYWWALFYWNARKTWFRMRGAHRDDCPCQTYADSGHALDSRCEAVTHWNQPARFKRVCPLLVQTPQGWRCSVNAESVRPFWGRAVLYGAALSLVLYLAATLLVFGVLRSASYKTSYLSVAWPPRWNELRKSQENLYVARAQQALQAGNYQEAILSLEMVTQLNPGNYPAGLTLAGLSQVAGQPYVADHIYERLMRDVPDQRRATAQIWFRTLLARGAYPRIKTLATVMLSEDPAERTVWLNAVFFACRQTRDSAFLGTVLSQHPHLPEWCTELIGIEHLLLQGHTDRALPRLNRVYRRPAAAYIPYYQIDRLLRLGLHDQANILLQTYDRQLQPNEAAFLRLRSYQAKGWTSLVSAEFDSLLRYELSPPLATQFCAYLVSHPDPALFASFSARFETTGMPVNADTVSLYHAAYLAAVLAGDAPRADQLLARITQYTASDARVLRGLGELLGKQAGDSRLPRILPLVPLPTEVTYAILERSPAHP